MKLPKVKPSPYPRKIPPKKAPVSPYQQFNLFLILTIFIPLLLVGAFNFLIDPYGVFNSPRLPEINEIKLAKLDNMRLFKAADIIRIKPVTIFLGTSRTEIGLVPEHPALKDLQPAYNLGLSFVSNYEALRYLEHTIANQPDLKLVVLGIDEFMFLGLNIPKPDFSENRLEKTHLILEDIINSTFSLTVLEKSLSTLQTNWSHQGDLYEIRNGRPAPKNLRISEQFQRVIEDYTKGYLEVDKNAYVQHIKYDDFQKIIKLCQEHNIELKIFISPVHASHLEIVYQTDQWETIENWKREVVKISPIPIWDFSGYNSITTEKISDNMENYEDNSHYSEKVGNLILNKLLNYQIETVPEDFGLILTPNNLEAHLQEIREGRTKWSKEHPEIIKEIQGFIQQYQKRQGNH